MCMRGKKGKECVCMCVRACIVVHMRLTFQCPLLVLAYSELWSQFREVACLFRKYCSGRGDSISGE